MLDQTYRDFELVVLDNASSDATGRIAPSFNDARVRVEINPATIPQPENWRAAVRLCRAPLIKLLCADDLLHPRAWSTRWPRWTPTPDSPSTPLGGT